MLRNRVFYNLKFFIPRRIQLEMRRWLAAGKEKKYRSVWPIDPAAGTPPENWKGWPHGKKFALVLSHDVDTQQGHDRVPALMDIEDRMGFKSSFNFVPERYTVDRKLIEAVKARGFQVCVHGLNHDGRLFFSREVFDERAKRINAYLREWGAVGFTSPSMHHNLEWMHILDILHSTSTFDTDPFEPQPDGLGTIFPLPVYPPANTDSKPNANHSKFYIELPYTLPQDHLLFVIMRQRTIDTWKQKTAWIAEKGGMALLNTHSDYMRFDPGGSLLEKYPVSYYVDFLTHVQAAYGDAYWHALPRDVAGFSASRR